MNLEIVDNFLPKEVHRQMTQMIMTPNGKLPFYVSSVVADEDWDQKYDKRYNYQFEHTFFHHFTINQETFGVVAPLIKEIKPFSLQRVKVNMNPWTTEIIEHGMHIDSESPLAKSAVYYLNTNNGFTIFEDGTRVESIANRLVTFDSNVNHTGTTCTDKIFRSVINVVYVPGPTKKELRE
jgi:hypothetical protein